MTTIKYVQRECPFKGAFLFFSSFSLSRLDFYFILVYLVGLTLPEQIRAGFLFVHF